MPAKLKDLPEKYQKSAFDPYLGGWEFVWPRDVMIRFLEDPETDHLLLLGIDVLEKDTESGRMSYSDCSWAVRRKEEETYEQCCVRARREAVTYVKVFPRYAPEAFFFPVITEDRTVLTKPLRTL